MGQSKSERKNQPYVGDHLAAGLLRRPHTVRQFEQALSARNFFEALDDVSTLQGMILNKTPETRLFTEIRKRLSRAKLKDKSDGTLRQYVWCYRSWCLEPSIEPEVIPAEDVVTSRHPREQARQMLSHLNSVAEPNAAIVELLKATDPVDDISELAKMDELIVMQEQRLTDFRELEKNLGLEGAEYDVVSENMDRLFRMHDRVCNLRADFGRYRRAKVGFSVSMSPPPTVPTKDQPRIVELIGRLLRVVTKPAEKEGIST